MQRNLIPVSELLSKRFDGQGDTCLIHQVKDLLSARLGITLKVDNSAEFNHNQFGYIARNINNEVLPRLEALRDNLEYDIRKNEDSTDLYIGSVNIALVNDKEAAEKAQEYLVNQVAEHLGGMQIDDAKPAQPAPVTEEEQIRHSMHVTPSLRSIQLKGRSLLDKVLGNFRQYQAYAELLICEYICRGDLQGLMSLMNIECRGTVSRSSSKLFANPAGDKLKTEAKTSAESYSYVVKANFDLVLFADYVREKAELARRHGKSDYLGYQDGVRECIEYVCGSNTPRTKVLIQQLDALHAWHSMECLFSARKNP